MANHPRLVSVVLEVADLERSERLYREALGLELHSSHHDDDDRWIGGAHSAVSWTDGAFAHFALYAAKGGEPTTGAQVGFRVEDHRAGLLQGPQCHDRARQLHSGVSRSAGEFARLAVAWRDQQRGPAAPAGVR